MRITTWLRPKFMLESWSMICSICKNKFTQHHHAQKYCSKKCAKSVLTPELKKKYRVKYLSNPKNKKKHYDYNKRWFKNNLDYFKLENMSDESKDKRRSYIQNYHKNYIKTSEYKKRRRAWFKNRKKNPLFKLVANMRTRINIILKQKKLYKNSRALDVLGCDLPQLKKYIESKFLPGMNWSNHTLKGWHVDHITPLASAKTIEDVERLMHYTNLQPMWAKDNIKKGKKII